MHDLMPAASVEGPPCLLDPEVRDLAASHGVPVGLSAGTEGQAVIAEAERSGRPGGETGHEERDVEDGDGQKSRVFTGGGAD